MLGHVYALSGRLAEGLELLQHALTAGEAVGFSMFLTPAIVHLGEARALAGLHAEAVVLGGRALQLARERGQRSHEAWALHLLADVALQRDARGDHGERGTTDHDDAATRYREAMTLAAELQMRPLLAHCHVGLGKLARRAGRREEAHEHFMAATTMWREMDMRFWLEQAEAELRALA